MRNINMRNITQDKLEDSRKKTLTGIIPQPAKRV
jgi:hypothetical protein